MTASPTRLFVALAVALALPLALLSATPASAATVDVSTWDGPTGIKAAFLGDRDTVRLGADITAIANEPLAMVVGANINLDLNGHTLTITEPGNSNPAIVVPVTSSLTINATGGGTLTATGGIYGAGIGGGQAGDGGTTIINGGTIAATGGLYAAGIGGGFGGIGGITTINGGTITATGGLYAAGIGGGESRAGNTTIINRGTVAATGGGSAAGIGGGRGGSVGVLEVNASPGVGAASDGRNPTDSLTLASPITNPTTPAGVGYSATTSTVGTGGRIELRFNYLITFAANGGSTSTAQTINDGDTLAEPATPTREGYEFAGWTSGGSAYDFSTPVTEPLTLSASWKAVLAATGVDVTTTLGLAALLIAGGIILIALSRRATHMRNAR